jgi:phage replication O-like protein O
VTLKVEQPVASYGNPQVEDGYTKIANELLDAIIRHDFSKRELKIVLFVLRKTYGWNKKADVISLSQILAGTGLARTHACSSVNDLVNCKVLLKQSHQKGQLLELNKKYKDWVCDQNGNSVTKTVMKCDQNGNKGVTKTGTTKDTSKNNTKEKRQTLIPDDFGISERVMDWAKRKGFTNLEDHLEYFVLKAKAKSYKYTDWDAAFMGAIRDNWANVQQKRNGVVL